MTTRLSVKEDKEQTQSPTDEEMLGGGRSKGKVQPIEWRAGENNSSGEDHEETRPKAYEAYSWGLYKILVPRLHL